MNSSGSINRKIIKYMSILSDSKLLAKIYSKELRIDPLQIENIQPSSIDLTLADTIEIPVQGVSINPPYPDREEIRKYFTTSALSEGYILKPGCFVLAQIMENIELSDKMVGNIQNRNSLIRLGINVGLSTYINPGYKGKLPIAIQNIGQFEVSLTPGMRICQLVLTEAAGVLQDYSKRDAKYHDEQNITLSRLSEDNEFVDYVRKYTGKADTSKLIDFLNNRIHENTKNFFDNLTEEQRKTLGLL